MVHQLFYLSSAGTNFDVVKDIKAILAKASSYNPKHNITGILLFHSGLFMQLLEGPKEEVAGLYNKIEKDPRHKNVIKVFAIDHNPRIFTNWSMAYKEVTDVDIKMVNKILSFNNLITRTEKIDNELIIQMLNEFKKHL
jgi:hypothetical protein